MELDFSPYSLLDEYIELGSRNMLSTSKLVMPLDPQEGRIFSQRGEIRSQLSLLLG